MKKYNRPAMEIRNYFQNLDIAVDGSLGIDTTVPTYPEDGNKPGDQW